MLFYEFLASIRICGFYFDLAITDTSGDVGLYYPGDCIDKLKFGDDLLGSEIIRFTIDFNDKSIFVLIKGEVL